MKKPDPVASNPVAAAIKKHCPEVQIGSRVYQVKMRTPKPQGKLHYYGIIDYTKELIEVTPDTSPLHTLDTFLHELIHGIINDRLREHMGGKQFEQVHEMFTGKVASGLAALLASNPGVAKVCGMAPSLRPKEVK